MKQAYVQNCVYTRHICSICFWFCILNHLFKPFAKMYAFFTWSPHVNAQQFILLYVQQQVSFPVLVNVAKFRRLFYYFFLSPRTLQFVRRHSAVVDSRY